MTSHFMMGNITPRRVFNWIVVLVGSATILSYFTFIAFDRIALRVRIALAKEQIDAFESMANKATSSNVREALGYMEGIRSYYPSGTKQEEGSVLDWIVERERKRAIERVERHVEGLRSQHDLGDRLQPLDDR